MVSKLENMTMKKKFFSLNLLFIFLPTFGRERLLSYLKYLKYFLLFFPRYYSRSNIYIYHTSIYKLYVLSIIIRF